jgi:hypothetical protein
MFRKIAVTLPLMALGLSACDQSPTDPFASTLPQKSNFNQCDPATYVGPGSCVPDGYGGFVIVS